MPIYQVDIEKQLGSEFWSNRYIVLAATLATAQGVGSNLVSWERSIHSTQVTVTRFRVSTTAVDDGVYTIVPVNLAGQRSVTNLLPLFNTFRVDIQAGVGRPSRKYYRGVLGESDINGSALVISTGMLDFVAGIESLFSTLESNGLVDPQGTEFVEATVYPFVQMRQLRRSRRRRTNDGGIFQ